MSLRSHKIRLDPTAAQEDYFRRACGTARFAYNWALAEWQRQYHAGEKPNQMALSRKLNSIKKQEFPWMVDVTKCAVQQAVKNLGMAYTNAFRRCKLGKRKGRKNQFGFPQFKKKGRRDSFRADNGPRDAISNAVDVDGKSVKLSRCGVVRMREAVRFSGRIIATTVSRVADGWYISIVVETDDCLRGNADAADVVGVDLGIKTLATLSDGRTIPAPMPLRTLLQRLKRLNRSLSLKVKGSANRAKAKTKLARLHNRISNVRNDALHKLTHTLATQFKTVVIEDLNVSGMMKNRSLSRAIGDVGFFEFRRQLNYKCEMTGAQVHLADRFYPSSKTCSGCGQLHDMPLGKRVMSCHCGLQVDRDLNAAINLRRVAPSKSVESEALTLPLCGDVKLRSMKQKSVVAQLAIC